VLFVVAIACALIFGRLEAAVRPLLSAGLWVCAAGGGLAIALWLAPIRPLAAGCVLIAVLAADVVVNNGPNGASALPSATLTMLEPDGRNETIALLKKRIAARHNETERPRIEMVGLGYHWPNTALTHNFHATLGANPVRLAHYVAATGAGDTAAEGAQRAFPPLFPSYASPLANLLGLRFIVTREPIEKIDKPLAPGTLRLVGRTAKARLYENPDALPRVIFARRSRSADFADIVRTGRWPTTDFRETVLLEGGPGQGSKAPRRSGNIAITSYRNTEVVVRVDSPDGGWAVLNDVWHPWWRGAVDGKPATIDKANVIFRAIKVPPGAHTVRFAFRPLAGAYADLTSRPSP